MIANLANGKMTQKDARTSVDGVPSCKHGFKPVHR